MANVFRDVIVFFGDIGIYDVVLPFLLVFTIIFAIFEKKFFSVKNISNVLINLFFIVEAA